jgi:hypothetical protein
MPTFNSLLAVSGNVSDGSLLRGFLWSSVIGSLMVTVAVYGFAILLNVQWLRLAGMYGLFCIFVKAWIMLVTWLSTSPAYWGLMANSTLNYVANFACIIITLLIYYAWQRRTRIRIERLTYFAGMIASYDLFLVFSFLLEFILFNVGAGLTMSFMAISLLVTAAWPATAIILREKLGFGRGITCLSVIGFVVPEIWATLVLLLPLTFTVVSQPWIFNVLTLAVMVASLAPVAILFILVVKRFRKIRLRTAK